MGEAKGTIGKPPHGQNPGNKTTKAKEKKERKVEKERTAKEVGTPAKEKVRLLRKAIGEKEAGKEKVARQSKATKGERMVQEEVFGPVAGLQRQGLGIPLRF